MDADALTVNAVRDGPVSTLILCGDLYLPEAGGFLEQAALAVSRTGSGMEGLFSRNWPRRSRAPRSSPGPRDARDYRVQRTRLPVPAHPAR